MSDSYADHARSDDRSAPADPSADVLRSVIAEMNDFLASEVEPDLDMIKGWCNRLEASLPTSSSVIKAGDQVVKDSGDYTFSGTVVSQFTKKSGALRFVVEHDDLGLLFIFSESQLRVAS